MSEIQQLETWQEWDEINLSTPELRQQRLEILLCQKLKNGEDISQCLQALEYLNGEQGTGNREQGLSVTEGCYPRQDLPPIGGRLKPIGGEREQTDKLLPVARSLFPLPKGVKNQTTEQKLSEIYVKRVRNKYRLEALEKVGFIAMAVLIAFTCSLAAFHIVNSSGSNNSTIFQKKQTTVNKLHKTIKRTEKLE